MKLEKFYLSRFLVILKFKSIALHIIQNKSGDSFHRLKAK